MKHEKFNYKSINEILEKCLELEVSLPFAKDTEVLTHSLKLGAFSVPNRLGIAPMEGADSTIEGSPSELTEKRYIKAATGGSGVIWYEAISLEEEGRSSMTQLLMNEKTLDHFKRMNERIKEAGLKANGFEPFLIMQANHSGRYSNPNNHPAPVIAQRNSYLESFRPADDSCIISDDCLKRMEEIFGESAKLAKLAGFNAIDIKSCHGYLFQEILASYDRKGEYGGSYENRTKLLKNSIKAAKQHEDKTFTVTSRVGIYDGYPARSRGFGQAADGSMELSEPKRLIKELHNELGIGFIGITMGNPYANTHVTRPFDIGKYVPDEHPLESLSRMIHGTGEIKSSCSDLTIYGSAPSYLREYSDLYAAGAIEQGLCDGFLFGRMSFADPDFANEIVKDGRINPKKVCLTCGKCGDLIRAHKPTGCVIRDSKTFMPFYKQFLEEQKSLPPNFRG